MEHQGLRQEILRRIQAADMDNENALFHWPPHFSNWSTTPNSPPAWPRKSSTASTACPRTPARPTWPSAPAPWARTWPGPVSPGNTSPCSTWAGGSCFWPTHRSWPRNMEPRPCPTACTGASGTRTWPCAWASRPWRTQRPGAWPTPPGPWTPWTATFPSTPPGPAQDRGQRLLGRGPVPGGPQRAPQAGLQGGGGQGNPLRQPRGRGHGEGSNPGIQAPGPVHSGQAGPGSGPHGPPAGKAFRLAPGRGMGRGPG